MAYFYDVLEVFDVVVFRFDDLSNDVEPRAVHVVMR